MTVLYPLTSINTSSIVTPPRSHHQAHGQFQSRGSCASLSSILTSSSSLASPWSDESGVPSWRTSSNSGFSEEWVVPLTPKHGSLSPTPDPDPAWKGEAEEVSTPDLRIDEAAWMRARHLATREPRTPTRADLEVRPDDSPTLPTATSTLARGRPESPSPIPPFARKQDEDQRYRLAGKAGKESVPPAEALSDQLCFSRPLFPSGSASPDPPALSPPLATFSIASSSSSSSRDRQPSISSSSIAAASTRSSRSSGSKRSKKSQTSTLASSSAPPVIPGRTTSRRPPAIPGRGTSLSKSQRQQPVVPVPAPSASVQTSTSGLEDIGRFVPSRRAPAPPVLRQRPIAACDHLAQRQPRGAPSPTAEFYQVGRAARSTHSLVSSRPLSTLDIIKEAPRDLDLSPKGEWSLRPRVQHHRLRRSQSQPDLLATPSAISTRDQALSMPSFKLKKSLSMHFGGSDSGLNSGPRVEARHLAPPLSARGATHSVPDRAEKTGFFASLLRREKSKISLYSLSNASAVDAQSGLVTPTNASFLELSTPSKPKTGMPRLELPFELAPSPQLGSDATPRPQFDSNSEQRISIFLEDTTEALEAILEAEQWDWPTPFPRSPRLGTDGLLAPIAPGGHQQHPSTFGNYTINAPLLRQRSQPVLPYSGSFISSQSMVFAGPHELIAPAEIAPDTPESMLSSSSYTQKDTSTYAGTPGSAVGRGEPLTPPEPCRTPELVMAVSGAYLPAAKQERKGSLPSPRRVLGMVMI